MAGLRELIAWWRLLPVPWRAWRVVGQVAAADEVPARLPDKGVVLVGPPRAASWAVFDCPCRKGHRLMVNLDRTRHPCWSVCSLKPLSILPSIDDMTWERRCHFVVHGGRIRWARHDRRVIE